MMIDCKLRRTYRPEIEDKKEDRIENQPFPERTLSVQDNVRPGVRIKPGP
jgi:hypothetical protein